LEVNTDSSVIENHDACGCLFRYHLGTFFGAFACNLRMSSVFYAEIHGFILALEYAAHNGWRNIWLESDSTSALSIFKNRLLVPVMLRNRWHNACNQGIQVISSHIFRECNCCTNLLANMGHSLQGVVWFSVLPHTLQAEFFKDLYRVP
jgi:ribonuclease HI